MLLPLLKIERDVLLEKIAAAETGFERVSAAELEQMFKQLDQLNNEIAKHEEAKT